MLLAAETSMAKKKAQSKPEVGMAKIASDVLKDARIVVAYTEEGLTEYLSRILRPIVARDKEEAKKADAARSKK
jgi:hypothetical protein